MYKLFTPPKKANITDIYLRIQSLSIYDFINPIIEYRLTNLNPNWIFEEYVSVRSSVVIREI